MPPQYVRQTAIPCTLGELKSGEWVSGGGTAPSGIRTSRGFVSRVSVMGVIVDSPEDGSFMVDDSTTAMRVRTFDAAPPKSNAAVGDLVVVIGRPREYENERYLVLEICKKLRDPSWVEYRRRELSHFAQHFVVEETVVAVERSQDAPQQVSVVVEKSAPKNPFEQVIAAIREIDDGSGAEVDLVLSRAETPDGKRVLKTLLEEGEIFELRPGRVKVLE